MKSSIDSKFKETGIGLIPEDWEVKKIKDVCKQVRESFNPNENDIRPYLGLEHINEGSLTLNGVGSSSDVKSGKLVFHKGQILFGKLRPYFRKVYRPDFDGVCSTDIFVIDKKDENDNGFLFYFFANPFIVDIATQSSEGTRMPRASWSYLSDLEFAFPTLYEQKAIGRFLSTLDQKISLNNQMNQTLEEIAQSTFRHWFVHYEFHDDNGQPYKSSGGEMVDSELGEIPKGWKVGKLGDLLKIQIGGDWGEDKEFHNSFRVTCLRGTDIQKLKEAGYTSEAPDRWIKRNSLSKRELTNCDVLLGASGLGPIGRSLYFSEAIKNNYSSPIIYSNFCKRLEAKSPELAIYSEKLIEYIYKRGGIEAFITGTSIPNLDTKGLLNLEIVIPPEDLIKKYSNFIKFKNYHQYNPENTLLSKIRDSLLPKLMSGKIRVPMEATGK